MRSDDVVTFGDFFTMLDAFSRQFTLDFVKVLRDGDLSAESFAARAARQRDEEMRTHDPEFHKEVQAVREARQAGAFVTEGVDVGHRHGPGLHKLSESSEDDDTELGPAQAAIRRRRARREQ